MTTTRKTLFLGASLAVAFAGLATAGERNRDAGESLAAEGVVATPATISNVHRVSAGIGTATVNGQSVTMRADGAVRTDDVIKQYGSIERMVFDSNVANVPSSNAPDGTRIFANGATGWYADLLGTSMPKPAPSTVAELKSVRPWIEKNIDGITVLAFADGTVINDSTIHQSEPAWVAHRDQVPNKLDINGLRIYADGAVFQEPAVQPKDGQ